MMTSKQKLVAGIVSVVVIVGTVVAVRYNRAYDPVANLTRVHAVELPFDSVRVRWWHQAATCLKIDTTYDAKLRYFTGPTIPKEWDSARHGERFGAYTDAADHLILLAPEFVGDSATVVHEQLHGYLKIGGHPQQYFSGRCGVAPQKD
jgi:hypothetical protein